MPMSCMLAAYGAVYGPYWLDQLFGFVMGFGFQVKLLASELHCAMHSQCCCMHWNRLLDRLMCLQTYNWEAAAIQEELLHSLVREHWSGANVLRLLASILFASLGALIDFFAVPALDVILGRDLGLDDEVTERPQSASLWSWHRLWARAAGIVQAKCQC